MSTAPKSKGRKKKGGASLAGFWRRLRKIMVAGANRIDFLNLLMKYSKLDLATPYREQLEANPDGWTRQEEMKDLAVRWTIEEFAQRGDKISEDMVRKHVEGIATWYDHETFTAATPSVPLVFQQVFQQADNRLQFTSPDRRELAHLEQLRKYRQQGLGVVYLCNHSSHLDEFMVDSLLAQCGLGIPLFAAGANMMAIDSLAKVLMQGSYVVRRKGGDKTYLATLFNYCRAISETGRQQGIFLEAWHGGARSRDGSLRYPRRLVTLRGALASEKELVIQPVAISYSIVPEDLPLAQRASGRSWVRGMGLFTTLLLMLGGPRRGLWRAMKGLWGRAYVTLPPPLLLSELKQKLQDDPSGLNLDEFVALNCIREIARSKKVMASQMVARGLMRARRKEYGDLADSVAHELKSLSEYHQTTFGQEPDLEDFIRENPLDKVVADGVATLRRRHVLWPLAKDSLGLPRVRSEAGLAFYATHGDRRIYSPTAQENLVVVGRGDWGFALTHLVGNRILEDKRYLNASLTLFEPRPEVARAMGVERTPSAGRFQGKLLPKNAFVSSDPHEAFRKASDVILVSPPAYFSEQAIKVLAHAEGPLRIVVGTAGFEPDTKKLPYQVLLNLVQRSGRQDVELFVLTGTVRPQDLVEPRPAQGILAGSPRGMADLLDLFTLAPLTMSVSDDPIGVQTAEVMSRIYALWGAFQQRTGEIKGSTQAGHYMARVSAEASRLAVALGGKAETFHAGSPAWTAAFVREALSGPSRTFGSRLGSRLTRRHKDVAVAATKRFDKALEKEKPVQAYQDLRLAWLAAQDKDLDLPILNQAYQTMWVEGGGEQDKEE